MTTPSTNPAAAAPSPLPLVSILLPTHNRPDYAELALRSAIAQTYQNIEIVVSDNSDDELTRERFAPYVARDERIRYHRIASCPALQNFQNCYARARGEYVNFLMDDDLFHPQKIATMMSVMLSQDGVGVVTSSRQLIDGDGGPMAAPPHLAPAFQVDTRIGGQSLGAHMLNGAGNMIGETTTALYRKAAAGPNFGFYMNRQYTVPSDTATWLTVLSAWDCVYLKDPLSSFRIHAEQDQRNTMTQIRGHYESLQMMCDVWDHGYFLPRGPALTDKVAKHVVESAALVSRAAPALRPGFDRDYIVAAIAHATRLLLT